MAQNGSLSMAPPVPSPQQVGGAAPLVSVILPVRNEAAGLPQLLARLLEQDYPPNRFEILVADGRSSDDTRATVLDCARTARTPVRLVDNPGIRSGPGRNAGLLASAGDFVIFIDGHCELPSRTLLTDTVALFAETGAACLCRPQPLLANAAMPTGNIIAAVRACWLGHGRDSLIYNLEHAGFVDPASSGASYRREVFAQVGMYDEQFDACEDVELNTRVRKAGLLAYTDPRLALFYEPRGSLRALWRQMLRYGCGRARLMRKHPDTWSLAQLAPLLLMMSGAAAVVAIPVSRGAALVCAIPVLCFAGAIAVCSVQLGRKHGARTLIMAPAVFATIYVGLGVGLGAGLLAGLLALRGARFLSRTLGKKAAPPALDADREAGG